MRRNKGRSRFLVLCVAPATILFFIFMIVPTLNVFRMSLYERGAYSPTETFVGLSNFTALLNDSLFIRSMQNMILLVVVVTIITFALALVFGLTVYADFREERMLAQVYGGSYVIDNGRRIDDLGLIRADIENALGEADRIEKRLGSADVVNETEQDVLDGISDPATRRQVEMMLNE